MRRIETIIFDVSGVLIDDLHTVWKADSDAYEACGLGRIETVQKFRASFRLPINDYHKGMGAPEHLIPKLEEEYRRAYVRYSDLIKIFPDVKDALEELRQKRIILGIASNIPNSFLEEHLRRFGIDRYFDLVTGQDDCVEQKPSPQPILLTMRKMGSRPACSAYVGDMEEDIIAGKRARVYTFAVCRNGSYHPAWKLRHRNPDFFVSGLSELVEIVKRLNSESTE